MDPKTNRFDPGTPSERDHLIARGHLALIAITSEAHAARVEAQKAELEVALAEARSGDANMLRNWLESYRGMTEAPNSELSIKSPLTPPLSERQFTLREREVDEPIPEKAQWAETTFAREELRNPELNWNRLLPAARQRLAARSSDWQSVERDALTDSSSLLPKQKRAEDSIEQLTKTQTSQADVSLIDGAIETECDRADAVQVDAELSDTEPDVDEFLDQERLSELDEDDEDEPLVYQDLPELQSLSDVHRDVGKPLLRSGTRGLVFSVVVHTALIGTLMAITMRVPDQVASLGFEASSSDVAVEAFEVMQPIEVTSPEEISPETPSETSESSVSLPSAVGLSSTSVSAAVPAAASGVSGVQASANRAMAATSGRPNPVNANASFFGAAASGNCFCYVIDGSESMRGGPWEAAKAELLRSLSTMKESHRFYIIFFNQNLNAISMPGEREPATSPLYATPTNLKHARNWIETLRIERGAPPNAALIHAIELEPDAIYLLADGATKIDLPEFLRSKNRTSDFISGEQVRVPIHAIAFYSAESGQKLMKQVAAENKGQFIYVPDPRKKSNPF